MGGPDLVSGGGQSTTGGTGTPTPSNLTVSVDLSPVVNVLNQILLVLNQTYAEGGQQVNMDLITVGTTPAVLYPTQKNVKGGFMLNLSTTDTITVVGGGKSSGKPTNGAAGKGIVLNPAAAAGQGGGTFNFGPVDLSTFTALTSTNNSQTLLVAYYNVS